MAEKSFSSVFTEIEGGQFNTDLTTEYRELVKEIQSVAAVSGSAKGSLTITLKFLVRDDVVEVVGETKHKRTELARRRTLFWSDDDGNLLRTNPRQRDLPLAAVVPARGKG